MHRFDAGGGNVGHHRLVPCEAVMLIRAAAIAWVREARSAMRVLWFQWELGRNAKSPLAE